MLLQLSKHNKELTDMLRTSEIASTITFATITTSFISSGNSVQSSAPGLPLSTSSDSAALDYYSTHTAQIEIVRPDRAMEQIVFPIPEICEYLTSETKHKVYLTAERDDQGSKVSFWRLFMYY